VFLDKDRTTDNFQKHNICTLPSSLFQLFTLSPQLPEGTEGSGRAVGQPVSRWLPTAAARDRVQAELV
jgi:hypothetical protein